jgi:signal transduction histidine kinase
MGRNSNSYLDHRSGSSAGTIEISVEELERDGARLAILCVGDTGPGVPSDKLQSILLPFYQANKSHGRPSRGFGVGLAIADRAVKLHMGQIVAWNKPSGGLVVEMSFPLALARAQNYQR